MDEREDRGFVVRDRRKVSLDSVDRESSPDAKPEVSAEREASSAPDRDSAKESEAKPTILPEVTMSTFILSLSSSALVHLGEIPDPERKDTSINLPLAKHIIDTLGMLEQKTKGNLDPEEDRLMKSLLYDLRLKYVQKSSK